MAWVGFWPQGEAMSSSFLWMRGLACTRAAVGRGLLAFLPGLADGFRLVADGRGFPGEFEFTHSVLGNEFHLVT
jgi:hypothetical protein